MICHTRCSQWDISVLQILFKSIHNSTWSQGIKRKEKKRGLGNAERIICSHLEEYPKSLKVVLCLGNCVPARAAPYATRSQKWVSTIHARELSQFEAGFIPCQNIVFRFFTFLSRWANTGAYKNQTLGQLNLQGEEVTNGVPLDGLSLTRSLCLTWNGDPITLRSWLGAPKCTLVKTHIRQSCPHLFVQQCYRILMHVF